MTAAILAQIDQTVAAAEAFSALLNQETAALKNSDYKTFESLQQEKLERAQTYQDAIMFFDGRLDTLKTLPPSTKDRLNAVYGRFQAAKDANQKTLLAAKTVAERVVRLIMDAAKNSVAAEAPGYSARGIQGVSDKIPVHFKLNEVL